MSGRRLALRLTRQLSTPNQRIVLTPNTSFPPEPAALEAACITSSPPPGIELTVTPTGFGRFAATLPNGEHLVTSHQPLFAGARALSDRGVDPATPLTMRHAGSAHTAMRSTVGNAAGWTVKERESGGIRIARYTPGPSFAP